MIIFFLIAGLTSRCIIFLAIIIPVGLCLTQWTTPRKIMRNKIFQTLTSINNIGFLYGLKTNRINNCNYRRFQPQARWFFRSLHLLGDLQAFVFYSWNLLVSHAAYHRQMLKFAKFELYQYQNDCSVLGFAQLQAEAQLVFYWINQV